MRRNTVQKTFILETVRSMKNHPTADEIYESVILKCPSISKGTVYRGLNQLAEDGKILRVEIANAPDRYDLTFEPHAHCLCTQCGRVFDYKLLVEPSLDVGANDGFFVSGIDIVVKGVCHECQCAEAE